jgi:Tfp pilus assembly protein PilN
MSLAQGILSRTRQCLHTRMFCYWHCICLQTSESAARSEGLAEIQRSIGVLEEQINGLKADVAGINAVKERETTALEAEERVLAPLAVLQIAQAQAALHEDAGKHWLHLAMRLGADTAGL